ncbi:hypothetical protein NEUTE1DRAFT_101212 [Neurospora tetrasperma FGSC 2508]|uniref:Uncharacterized protein n=1 Tax=Neurospora tetrasperma (strain FGSC 2508 / ATCC MYA-4615 / P0657) TaxID=510951 RepID=F8ML25_NEUT8|nr:uncharacterized protein NEUTE1DRAFT_101212 [Neurospora tetrasperma FGSC 2508]EGO58350.1 hypothetical protein NEUTE1DRAFT_101212 [Neurospora tetrasperma FGSC 2508]EGZ71326.1 hypothetical protein NEUTE2DRAFT_166395 [Neurospora tetrasperma FGSC 2509]
MGLPLYRSPSSEALRRQAANQAANQQQQPDPRRARSGAPPPPLRREDAQRLFSQTPSEAATGTQERPIDLTRRSLEVEAPRRPVLPPRFAAPIPSTEDEESAAAASAVLSRYSRTSFNSSELATPAEEEELRLPDYGTPDMDWSTPEIEAASTPPRPEAQASSAVLSRYSRTSFNSSELATPAEEEELRLPDYGTPDMDWSTPEIEAASTPPRPEAQASAPAAPQQPQQRQQQQVAGPSQAAATQEQQRQASGGGRGGFVQVVVSQDSGLAQVQVQGSGEGQTIPPSLRLPPLPRPSDATIRGARRQRLGQSGTATQNTSSTASQRSRSGGSGGSRSADQSSRMRSDRSGY